MRPWLKKPPPPPNALSTATARSEDQDKIQQLVRNQRDTVSGVSLDEEMADLVKFQRAFQASSRVFSVVDELLDEFAVNDIAFSRDTGFAWEQMNNYGSSIIWGHPQGPTGMRGVIVDPASRVARVLGGNLRRDVDVTDERRARRGREREADHVGRTTGGRTLWRHELRAGR